jgi:adenine-specific DNA-methyltransferase
MEHLSLRFLVLDTEDFSKQKIVWKRVGSILRFSYDESGTMALDSTCFATGNQLKFLLAMLNSSMGHYLMKDAPQTGTGDLLISVQAIEPLKIPIPNIKTENCIEMIVDAILTMVNQGRSASELQKKLNKIIYEMYELNDEEVSFIESL